MSGPKAFDPEPYYPALVLLLRPRDPDRRELGGDATVFGTGFFIKRRDESRSELVTVAHNLTKQKYEKGKWYPDPDGDLLQEVTVGLFDSTANPPDWTAQQAIDLKGGVHCWLRRDLDAAILHIESDAPAVLNVAEEVKSGDGLALLGFQTDRRRGSGYAVYSMLGSVPLGWLVTPFDPLAWNDPIRAKEMALNYNMLAGYAVPLGSGISGGPVLNCGQSDNPVIAIQKGILDAVYKATLLEWVWQKQRLATQVIELLVREKFSESKDASEGWTALAEAVKKYVSAMDLLKKQDWAAAKTALAEAQSGFKGLDGLTQPIDFRFIDVALNAVEALRACHEDHILKLVSGDVSLLPPRVRKNIQRINRGVRLYEKRSVKLWCFERGIPLLGIVTLTVLLFALNQLWAPTLPCRMDLEMVPMPSTELQSSLTAKAGSEINLAIVLKEPNGRPIRPSQATFEWSFYPPDHINTGKVGNRNHTLSYRVPRDGRQHQVIVVSARTGARYCQEALEINISE
jgi:hypothetical protein